MANSMHSKLKNAAVLSTIVPTFHGVDGVIEVASLIGDYKSNSGSCNSSNAGENNVSVSGVGDCKTSDAEKSSDSGVKVGTTSIENSSNMNDVSI